MTRYTASHWGIYEVHETGPSLRPWREDRDPSPIGLHMLDATRSDLRVKRPAVRLGWLEGKRTRARGKEPFVQVEWDEALDLVANELQRVRDTHGNEAIFGGSYGWASAGRFHHSVGQLHRFLNTLGGYVRSVDSYSLGAGRVLLPHIVAPMDTVLAASDDWDTLAEHTRLVVSFGGMPHKSAQIDPGGAGRHRLRGGMEQLGNRGVRVINIGPCSEDVEQGGNVEWLPIRPNTDTAMMLALAHGVIVDRRQDRAFLRTHCVGYEKFEAYVLGRIDGTPKDASWAARITGASAERIRALSKEIGSERTLLTATWSLQRSHHGEQPFWCVIALAAMLGQIGLPGGGFGLGYGATNSIGYRGARFEGPTLPQGRNAVGAFIPVARIADMLLEPGAAFDYNGARHQYPSIKLVYWAGGNPFHHHQDLNRLVHAWQRPETIIAHEQFWNAHAKMADIVLPATTTLERDDIGFSSREAHMVAMRRVIEPVGEARDDFDIFNALAQRLGVSSVFSEDRDTNAWLKKLYDEARPRAAKAGIALPSFDTFWQQGLLDFAGREAPPSFLRRFRESPEAHPLPTPSGKIEIFSERMASFGYEDCPGYPCWFEPAEWTGSKSSGEELHLLSDQPATKLHSQLDHSTLSRAARPHGREPLSIHPSDAVRLGLNDHDPVRVFNARGACIAIARVTATVMPGVVKLSTGAWFDPGDDIEKHGNPNVLTADRPASKLSQGCSAQTCLVSVERWHGPLPDLTAFTLPEFVQA
ncbi:molybdopterin-dependent oxidoreductase [Caballeronia sp. dw_276]|uniref:molybdopterin-dependent oxidoreductase n=1 Tax=Caballeronia sp. dw_276 TaxID=2719795 RepID=UPI001BD27FDB|nr:molybdopterin-dependent oxidoreductase [Caballeronia sp. dw_276]